MPSEETQTNSDRFIKHPSINSVTDPSYNSDLFKPTIQIYNSDNTIYYTISSTNTSVTTTATNLADKYIKFTYDVNSPYVDSTCNGTTIIRFSRIQKSWTTNNVMNNINNFMSNQSNTSLQFKYFNFLPSSFFVYNSAQKDKQLFYNETVAKMTNYEYSQTISIPTYPSSGTWGPCYLYTDSLANEYVLKTDGIPGDFVELEFHNPVILNQFSFSSNGIDRCYPRIMQIIASNNTDSNGNILYSKLNTIYGWNDAGGDNNVYRPGYDNDKYASTSNWYTIVPSNTITTKYKYFRVIIVATHSDSDTGIGNMGFKVTY